MNRKEFIQASALATGALALSSFDFPASRKVGLQLYTVRDVLFKDPKGVTKQIADLGFQEIETFSYNDGKIFGMAYKEYADYVSSLGMKITSGHYSYGNTERTRPMKGTILNEWERAVADAKAAGQEYMVLAYLAADERAKLDDYKMVIEKVNKAGEICKKYGVRMQYHNHDFEFVVMEGTKPYDLMLSTLDPSLVGMELDLYWTVFANEKPLDYFSKYPGRFEQWHVKDMKKEDPKKNADVGSGTMDFKSVFAKAEQAGLKHFYLEHDNFTNSSIESIREGMKNVKSWSWI